MENKEQSVEKKEVSAAVPEPLKEEKEVQREPVKEKGKIKRPCTDKRREQLAKARAAKAAKKAAGKQQSSSSSMDIDDDDNKSTRLVKHGNESAERFKQVLSDINPDLKVSAAPKTTSNKKRKVIYDEPSLSGDIDMKTAAVAGLALLGVAGATYVAGKNLTNSAMKSGFTGSGSAIPGDVDKGIAPITLITPSSSGRPFAAPSLGLYSSVV